MFSRLIPSANAAAIVSSVVHVVSLSYESGLVHPFILGIAALTYVITFIAAIPFGVILLTLVGIFDIGLVLSLALFLIAAPVVVISISTVLFGFDPETIPLEYAFTAIPAVISAWYFSVFYNWKKSNKGRSTGLR